MQAYREDVMEPSINKMLQEKRNQLCSGILRAAHHRRYPTRTTIALPPSRGYRHALAV
jgi:hypothetical protein